MLGRRMKAIVKGADYSVDLNEFQGNADWLSDIRRLSDLSRKRVRGVSWRKDKMSDSVDKHYLDFLLDLEHLARVGGVKEDEDDPEYVMFLENLVEVERSYVLDKSIEHSVHLPIMYEVENTSPNKTLNEDVHEKRTVGEVIKRRKLVSHTSNYIQEERRTLNVTQSSGYKKIVTKPDGFDYFHEEQRTKKRKSTSLSYDNIQEERSLKINHGKKSRSEIPGCREIVTMSASIDCFHEEQGLDVFGDSRSAPKNLAYEVYDLFLENVKEKGELCVYEYGDTEQVYYDSPNDQRLSIAAGSSTQLISVVAASSDQPKQEIVYYDSPNDQRLAIAAGSSKQPISVVAASSDQPKREIVQAPPSNVPACKRRRPPLPPKVPVSTQKQPIHTPPAPASRLTMAPLDMQPALKVKVTPTMRKKLHAILSRPYSQQEHDVLWKELSSRSAVLIHRDSRSGGSDRPGQMGRSLLDFYSDLQSEIENVKSDPHKVLNLLRMLSFYIKKLPCGNICKPWLDDSLMTIIPGSA